MLLWQAAVDLCDEFRRRIWFETRQLITVPSLFKNRKVLTRDSTADVHAVYLVYPRNSESVAAALKWKALGSVQMDTKQSSGKDEKLDRSNVSELRLKKHELAGVVDAEGKPARPGSYAVEITTSIVDPPTTLLMGLIPQWNADNEKPLRRLKLDLRIQLDAAVDPSSSAALGPRPFTPTASSQFIYELDGVVVHDGLQFSSGHYYAYRRHRQSSNSEYGCATAISFFRGHEQNHVGASGRRDSNIGERSSDAHCCRGGQIRGDLSLYEHPSPCLPLILHPGLQICLSIVG